MEKTQLSKADIKRACDISGWTMASVPTIMLSNILAFILEGI